MAEATTSLAVKCGGGKPPPLSVLYSGGVFAALAPDSVSMKALIPATSLAMSLARSCPSAPSAT
jgi:hypothetical protein